MNVYQFMFVDGNLSAIVKVGETEGSTEQEVYEIIQDHLLLVEDKTVLVSRKPGYPKNDLAIAGSVPGSRHPRSIMPMFVPIKQYGSNTSRGTLTISRLYAIRVEDALDA